MPLTRFFRCMMAPVTALALFAGPTATATAAAALPAVEPRAAEILTAALTHLAGMPSVRIRADVVTETVLASGQKLQYPGTLEIAMRRPDRLWYKLDSEQRRVVAWYDGKNFTLLDSEKNVCATTSAPAGLGPLFDDMAKRLRFRPPLSVLLREDSPAVVAKHMISGFYVGKGTIGGTECHHLSFEQQSVDLEFWIAAAGPPAIKRIVITQKKRPAEPQLSYTIVSYEPDAAIDDTAFTFVPPPSVVRCEFETLAR